MEAMGFKMIPSAVALANIPAMLRNPIPKVLHNLEKYGDPYGVKMGKQLAIVTARPSIIQHILQKNHRNYTKSDIQTRKLAMFLGKGLLTMDGEEWLKQRRLIQPGFHKQKIEALQTNMMQTSKAMFHNLQQKVSAAPATVDMKPFMMKMAFQMVSNALFSGVASSDQLHNIRMAIESAQNALIKLIRLPFLEGYFKLAMVPHALKKVDRSCKDLHSLITDRRKKGIKGEGDLLDMLLAARYEDTGEPMTDQQLIFELLVLFVAGHETTAHALSWSVYLLAQHPDIVRKIREEIAQGGEAYTYQVINEVLRMYPPAWITDRLAITDDEVDGIQIPAGSLVAGFIYGTHHLPNLWHDPATFDPDRFVKDAKHMPFSFLPFGGGPRLCIGMQFALMEMKIVIHHLATHFDFEMAQNASVKMRPLVTLGLEGSLYVRLTAR